MLQANESEEDQRSIVIMCPVPRYLPYGHHVILQPKLIQDLVSVRCKYAVHTIAFFLTECRAVRLQLEKFNHGGVTPPV